MRAYNLRNGDPVWAWGGAWKPARVVVPALGLNSRRALVCFDTGVTALLNKSKIRPRDPRWRGVDKPGPGAVAIAAMAGGLLRRVATADILRAWELGLTKIRVRRGWSKPGVELCTGGKK